MGLQIKHNRAEHTHENEQFRRIATSLRLLFDEQKWDGLLIGNPYNENYSRFRPDGILLYTHGLIIIDLKAYSGNLKLPPNKLEFESTSWHTESDKDKTRIRIKAGNRFINPFKQLDSYRKAFKEIVSHELGLKGSLNEHKTCALNIFSGPLSIQNFVPREIPYYKIIQEKDLGSMLYDYSSENSFSRETASCLCSIFNAEDWQEHIEMPQPEMVTDRKIAIDSDVEKVISEFLKIKKSGVLILESMDSMDRDNWVEYILSQSQEFEIPQVETWIHSARIGRKVSARMNVDLQSLYSTIYGGAPRSSNVSDANELEEKQSEEHLQETVPLRSDDTVDESAVIILHEAHLVSRSLHQSELLRFGTGRLLEDLLTFLNLTEKNRKLICIGDPYSLTYGKDIDSAINSETIAENYSGEISHFRKPIVTQSSQGKLGLRLGAALGIENKEFNNLSYSWRKDDLSEITKAEIPKYLTTWFKEPIDSEPSKTVMVYTNKDARKINLWIKRNAIQNGKDLAVSDLLILGNNINIPETVLSPPTKLYNGMFLLVKSVGDSISKTVSIKQSSKPITLNFTKVQVACLSLPNRLETDLYLLENYLASDSGLSKEEQIAFRVFVNQLVKTESKKNPFERSPECNKMQQDKNYIEALQAEADLQKKFKSKEKVKTKLETQQREIRKIERHYQRVFKHRLLSEITQNDPFVNAGHVSYGWALTVHKSIGSSFSQAIINAYQGENRGTTNADYYRWLYSGVTTVTNDLLVANPQIVHPLMDTHFEDASSPSVGNEIAKKKLLTYPDYQAEERFTDKIPEPLRENLIGAICELSIMLEEHGLLLESIIPNGDYLTKAVYSTPSSTIQSVVIAINNKGPKDSWSVSSIRIEQANSDYENALNNAIDRLFSAQQMQSASKSPNLPGDFRKPVYRRWHEVMKEVGYELSLMESHNHQDVFSVAAQIRNQQKFVCGMVMTDFLERVLCFRKARLNWAKILKSGF